MPVAAARAGVAAAAALSGASAAPIFPAEWDLLGPFMAGGRGGADPVAAFLGASGAAGPPPGLVDARDANASFPSELAEVGGGRAGWVKVKSGADGVVAASFLPQSTWEKLQGQYGQAGTATQGWAVGSVRLDEESGRAERRRYLAQCTGTREYWVLADRGDSARPGGEWQRFHGNQYGDPFTFLKGPVELTEEAIFAVRFMGSAGAAFSCQIEPWSGQPLEFVKNDPMLPDLVDGTLASSLASVVVRNNDPSGFLTVVNATVDLPEGGGEPSWLSGSLSAGAEGLKLGPGQSRPVDLELAQSAPAPSCGTGAEKQSVTFSVQFLFGDRVDPLSKSIEAELLCANFSTDPYKFTFRDFDGSVQFASLIPPTGPCGSEPCSVLLATHGASVDAGSPFWTKAYRRQAAAWVILPTNKRGFGYDWQGAGLRNALHSVQAAFGNGHHLSRVPGLPAQLATNEWRADPLRVLYSGHSMGGHGCLIMSTHFPEGELASACTAGWIKSEMYPPQYLMPGFSLGDAHLNGVLLAAIAEYDTDFYLPNMLGHSGGSPEGIPMLVRMGAQDEDVPAFNLLRVARLRGQLEGNASFVEVSEVPGKPHWWDGVVDDDRMQAFYDQHLYSKVPRPLNFSLRGVNPATLGSRGGLSILQLRVPYRAGNLEVSISDGPNSWAVRTTNVRRLQFEPQLMRAYHPVSSVSVDGQWLELGAGVLSAAVPATAVCQEREGGGCTWSLDADDTWRARERTPGQYGPASAVFEGPVTVVYGDADWALAAAVHLANDLYSQGRYSVEVVAHTDALGLISAEESTNLVVIGERRTNTVLDALASRWEEEKAGTLVGHSTSTHALHLGGGSYTGPGLGVQYLAPLPGRDRLALVVSGTDEEGTLAACQLFMGYQGYKSGMMVPDFMIVDQSFAWAGTGGIRAAGFWGNDWRASPLNSYLSEAGDGRSGTAPGGRAAAPAGCGNQRAAKALAIFGAFLGGAVFVFAAQWALQKTRPQRSMTSEGVYERLIVPAEPPEMRDSGAA